MSIGKIPVDTCDKYFEPHPCLCPDLLTVFNLVVCAKRFVCHLLIFHMITLFHE